MRARLRITAAAGMALLLSGCTTPRWTTTPPPAPPPPSASPSTPVATAPCASDGSLLRVETVNAAMGLRALGISLINCGRTPYQVDGYPEVVALGDDRSPLPVQTLDGVGAIAPGVPAHAPPSPITLKPGARATAVIVWRNTYDDTRKPPVTVALLRMATQPGRPAHLLAPEGGLDLGSTARFGVSPWFPAPGEAAAADQPVSSGLPASLPAPCDACSRMASAAIPATRAGRRPVSKAS